MVWIRCGCSRPIVAGDELQVTVTIEALRTMAGNDMVTTRGEEEKMEAAFRAGCTDFVTKPINHGELTTKIRAYLQEAGS